MLLQVNCSPDRVYACLVTLLAVISAQWAFIARGASSPVAQIPADGAPTSKLRSLQMPLTVLPGLPPPRWPGCWCLHSSGLCEGQRGPRAGDKGCWAVSIVSTLPLCPPTFTWGHWQHHRRQEAVQPMGSPGSSGSGSHLPSRQGRFAVSWEYALTP